jgi:ATP-dependent Zn protease
MSDRQPIPRESRQQTRKTTAYHEAGHASACIFENVSFDYVTIWPGIDFAGALRHEPMTLDEDGEVSDDDRWRHARISLAGPMAEERLTGRYNSEGASADADNVWNLFSIYADYQSRIDRATEAAREMVAMRWPSIKRIALALRKKETLSYDEVRMIAEGQARIARVGQRDR